MAQLLRSKIWNFTWGKIIQLIYYIGRRCCLRFLVGFVCVKVNTTPRYCDFVVNVCKAEEVGCSCNFQIGLS